MSSDLTPRCSSTSREISAIERTATLNSSLPFIFEEVIAGRERLGSWLFAFRRRENKAVLRNARQT